MPTLPVSELVAVNILSTIQGVTTDAGYNYTLSARRVVKGGNKVDHLNAIIVQGDPREASDPKVYNTKEWWLPFEVGVVIIPLEKDSTPLDQYINIVSADVHKALMVDRYRGGNALDTQVRPSRNDVVEGKYDCIVINVEVNYRTSELDPYLNAR